MSQAGGSDWNQVIADSRLEMKAIRDAVTLLRSGLMDIIVANPGNEDVIMAMLELSNGLDNISTASENVQAKLLRLYEIGVEYRKARKQKRQAPNGDRQQ